MTVISEPIQNIAGLGERQKVRFTVPVVRESVDNNALVTTRVHEVAPVNGVLTTPDLDPGPAKVWIGADEYDITVPDSSTPVRLWPLIDAGMPTPPEDAPGFVRDGGNVARIKAMTQAQYNAMATPDPATLYIITDSETN